MGRCFFTGVRTGEQAAGPRVGARAGASRAVGEPTPEPARLNSERGAVAEFNEVYRRSLYYDIAFRRDVTAEVTFIERVAARSLGRRLESVAEIACGPGYHVREFARRGARAIGMDLRPEMIEFARTEAAAEGVAAEWIVDDMRRFALDCPVDVVATMYDSLDCLQTTEQLVNHFRAVGGNLVPGGIYVIEMTHPRDCSMTDYGHFRYQAERDGVRVVIDWAINRPIADPLTQIVEVETMMRVWQNGRMEAIFDHAVERFIFPQELLAIARLSGALEPAGFYGDFGLEQPFDSSPTSRRMIGVFRRPR
jgi:SAM-dependent methyltransferase